MTATPRWALHPGATGSIGSNGPELTLPDTWHSVDLLSDLHLGPRLPGTTQAFVDHLQRTRADAVLLLGDIFEVWIGDDALDEAGSFEARLRDALREASKRLSLAFLPGNRDFLVGERFATETGCLLLPDPTLLRGWGRRVLLMHGDALCLDDAKYQAFRSEVRSPTWQAAFLARPLAQRQALAAQMRAASEDRKRAVGPEGYGDLDHTAMLAALDHAAASELVHGHTHRPATEQLAPGRRRWVLSDWDREPASTAPRADLIRFSASGLQRLSPAEA